MNTPSSSNTCRSLYLDLLEKSLTNTLLAPELDREIPGVVGSEQFKEHYIQGNAVTLLSIRQLENIRECVEEVLHDGVPGDFIETGVWRGGATIFMRAILRSHDVSDRCVWVADSFAGLPDVDVDNFPKDRKFLDFCQRHWNNLASSMEEVKTNFAAYGLLDEQVRFIKGLFKDTLPHAPIGRLALMRLDGDYYESTMDALTNLYDKLSTGGFVIVDDYHHGLGCRDAVDEFRAARAIADSMTSVGGGCHWWQKS